MKKSKETKIDPLQKSHNRSIEQLEGSMRYVMKIWQLSKKFLNVAMVIALVIAMFAFDAQPAYADAYKCVYSDLLKANCMLVRSYGGSGPDIAYIGGSRGGSTLDPTVCDAQFLYVITRRATLLASARSPVVEGCGFNRGWTFSIGRTFPSGSKVCLYVFEEGRLTSGVPCATIY